MTRPGEHELAEHAFFEDVRLRRPFLPRTRHLEAQVDPAELERAAADVQRLLDAAPEGRRLMMSPYPSPRHSDAEVKDGIVRWLRLQPRPVRSSAIIGNRLLEYIGGPVITDVPDGRWDLLRQLVREGRVREHKRASGRNRFTTAYSAADEES